MTDEVDLARVRLFRTSMMLARLMHATIDGDMSDPAKMQVAFVVARAVSLGRRAARIMDDPATESRQGWMFL